MRPPHVAFRAIAPIALAALVTIAVWPITFGGLAIARGDLLLYFYPLRDFAAQAAREGRLPLWNPYTFMGAPFLANSQAGFFYPFNLLLSWLPADRAIAWQIGLHLFIAALGAFALARGAFGLKRLGAFCAAVAFGLGGYLGAQAEHVNQLQALAWLPLMLLAGLRLVDGAMGGERISSPGIARAALVLSGLITLQLFAGHTQSFYISLITLGAACAARALLSGEQRVSRAAIWIIPLGAAIALGGLLAAAQLAPTLELSGESARAGGLPFNEAGSFSWRPWVAARALLPTFGDPLFPEYIAYVGAAGLALALAGIVLPGANGGPRGRRTLALGLTLAGVILAIGVATPLFGALYRWLPGFNLFRAQARWLAMAALGASLLIGLGADALGVAATRRRLGAWLVAWLGLVAAMAAGLALGARLSPEAEYRGLPASGVLMAWALTAGLATSLVVGTAVWPQARRVAGWALPALLVAELLVAAQFQPYARASDRQALTDLRPATTHLLVEYDQLGSNGRILALSGLFFDPGDLVEQRLIYGPGLSADGLYDRIIASKQKEILSPNLSLTYRLPSVDGYDGGLLPLKRYADFVGQFAQRDKGGSLDGRLREALSGVPADTWLSRMAVRYVIADKTADVFIDGVYYDLLFSAPISPALRVPLQPYASTALGLVLGSGEAVTATLDFGDGVTQITPMSPVSPTFAARVDLARRRVPLTLTLAGRPETTTQLRGLTSIDATDGSFLSQSVGGEHGMRVVHSGDVKIYENLNSAPRALVTGANGGQGSATIVESLAERVRVALPAGAGAGQLVLRDACYPGWQASVDGIPANIACYEGLFRSVALPAGAREVIFSYAPQSVQIGLALSAMGAMLWLALGAGLVWWRVKPGATPDQART